MKVLHLSTFDRVGGAAIAAFRQHRALREFGVDSEMLVRFKTTNDEHVRVFQDENRIQKIRRSIKRRCIAKAQRKSKVLGSVVVPNGDVGREILNHLGNPDIVNLHQVGKFLDEASLFASVPKSLPMVVTLHDLGWITGGCSYASGCERFADTCGRCPQLSSTSDKDVTRQTWIGREKQYDLRDDGKLAFVADSDWVLGEMNKSSLARGRTMARIHYGVDTQVFHPVNRDVAKKAWGFDPTGIVIMFAAALVSDERKGFQYLVDAVSEQESFKDFQYLSAGKGHPVLPEPLRHLHAGPIESDEVMASLYRTADIFVMPSIEEAFGQTALEAVACGTPVVAFDVGGISDTVKPGLNGVLVDSISADSLRDGITKLLRDASLRHKWPTIAQNWASENFSYTKNASEYSKLYSQLIEGA